MTDHPERTPNTPCPGPRLSRRGALLGLAAGLTLGGTRLAFGQGAPGEARLVVVLLRGGLDSLSAVPAYGDPAFAGIRGPLALPEPGREGGVLDLGGRFGLHPSLAKTHALYRAGQALIVHAVAGPYRVRSHFDAQDMLESGALQRLDSGWLNRALAGLPGSGGQPAGLAVGLDVPLLMKGPTPVRNYAPHGTLAVDEELMTRVQRLLSRDPTFGPVIARAQEERGFTAAVLRKEGEDGEMMGGAPVGRNSFGTLSGVAGRLMAAPNGPRVAALEQGGWDTHTSQVHRLTYALGQLDAGIAALREGLGDAWRHTAVLIVTEFGRTARANGTGGTDHGTAGAAFLVGGAVAGGKVRTDWPGLGQGKLFEDRDLAPTTDLRAVAKGLLRDHLKLPPAAVERAFPESGAVAPMAGLVRA